MLDKQTYNIMKKLYGEVGSWAIRGEQKDTPRSNTDDMTWVDDPNMLNIINTGYVFVGLNWSSTHGDKGGVDNHVSWSNFHSGYSFQNDYKLRYALKDTRFWGSYITDLIKYYPEVNSGKVSAYLKENSDILLKNIELFKQEIGYLGDNLKLIALGSKVHKLLNKYLGKQYEIFLIKHYSYAIGKENYRDEVLSILE